LDPIKATGIYKYITGYAGDRHVLNAEIAQLRYDIASLTISVNEAQEYISIKTVALTTAESELEELQTDLAAAIASGNASIATITTLNASIAAKEAEITVLNASIAAKEAEITVLNADIIVKSAEIEELNIHIDDLAQQNANLATDLESYYQSYIAATDALAYQAADYQSQIDTLNVEGGSLSAYIATQSQEIEALNLQIQQLLQGVDAEVYRSAISRFGEIQSLVNYYAAVGNCTRNYIVRNGATALILTDPFNPINPNTIVSVEALENMINMVDIFSRETIEAWQLYYWENDTVLFDSILHDILTRFYLYINELECNGYMTVVNAYIMSDGSDAVSFTLNFD
jgi:hypothetical protein